MKTDDISTKTTMSHIHCVIHIETQILISSWSINSTFIEHLFIAKHHASWNKDKGQ